MAAVERAGRGSLAFRALAGAALLAMLAGCVLPENARRAIRLRASLGDDIDAAEFEDVLLFAWDRHVSGASTNHGRAVREGFWVFIGEFDPDCAAIPFPERALLIERAGRGASECAGAVEQVREAWNARYPGQRVEYSQLAERALQCLLPRLDPHSAWFPRREWGDMARSLSGKYSGIGVVVQPGDEPTITEVFEGGPSDGLLRKKDLIVAVDAKPVKGLSAEEYLALIRGEAGTELTLTIRREGSLLDFKLTRREVQAKAVRRIEAGPAHDVLVLRLWSFTDGCAAEMTEALRRCVRPPRGIVLDLRNNPGGTVDDAVAIVDLFIDQGVVITERGAQTRVLEAEDPGAAVPESVPLLVLVNRFSASASELSAGALQDHGRAVVMGETSYGKGTVQEIYRLGDRGAKVTVSRFYLPAGRSTQLAGIAPDLPFPDPEAEKLAATGPGSFERDYDNAIPADAVDEHFRRTSDPAPLLARLKGRLGAGKRVDPDIEAEDAMLQEAVRLLGEEPAAR
ncbi:MAG: S41 family peptidase [Planctomycetes bacterium]|nr:S41 family peptidase [Planctomycetota bacterium]